ncbi:MAG: TonB-dependent receptor plug domain-containing protein, partial [Gemmatimonadota bacterium]
MTVEAGQVATADFTVEQTALKLQDIVVTGVVGETPRVKLPFVVERLDPQDLPVPAANVASLLAGKAAGVSVVQGSGQPGEAASITLRGPTSIDASGRSQGPLIVIDGVVQSLAATLADVNALDIDHIEIVKGAAAASLYGARAQAGVIQITTKRGQTLQTNTFNVLARGEYGINQIEGSVELANAHPYVMNAAKTLFVDADGNEVEFTNLGRPGFGSAVLKDGGTPETTFADNPWPVFNDQLDRFFDPGETYSAYGAMTGRFGESSFRVSFEQFRQEGVIKCGECAQNQADLNAQRLGQGLEPFNAATPEDEGYERQNARLNVDTRIGQFDIAASGFFSRSEQDDAAISNGSFFSLTFMSPAVDLAAIDPTDGFPIIDIDPLSLEENPLYQLAIAESFDNRTRTMGSMAVSWNPLSWLSFEGNASFDRTDFDETDLRPKSEKTSEAGTNTFTGGSLEKNNFVNEARGLSFTGGVNRAFFDDALTMRVKAHYVLAREDFESNAVEGNNFSVDGVPVFGAIEGATEGDRQIRQLKSQGYFGIASLDYRGKYIVDGLVRRDGSSLFGPDERWHTYYRGSAAWRISQEEFWGLDWWDEFKLRFSVGTAGARPRFEAQYETFGVGSGQIFPINLGNRALKPEFTTEREAGVNIVMFQNIGLDYTYAWADTEDQLLLVPQPAPVGFSNQWQNAGSISSETHEVSLRWAAIDQSDVGLQFRVSWDRTQQEITALDVPPYTLQGYFYVAPGRPLGEMWGDKWAESCADLAPRGIDAATCGSQFAVNSDGFLVFVGDGNTPSDGLSKGLWGTEGTVGSEAFKWGFPIKTLAKSPVCIAQRNGDPNDECPLVPFLPLGNTTPDWSAAFATNFRYKGLSLAALLDASVGFDIYNNTRQWAIRELRGADVGQTGKSDGEKRPIGYYSTLYNVN